MNWNEIEKRLENHLEENVLMMTLNEAPLTVKRASVLIPLFEYEGDVYVVLTKRSDKLTSHSGDVCFPGGKQDEHDKSEIHTALRETQEEIGLEPSNVRIIGRLMPFLSLYGIIVTPVVGVITDLDDVKLKINTHEVDDIFACPLSFFNSGQSHKFMKGVNTKLHSFLWHKNPDLYKPHTGNEFLEQVLLAPKNETFIVYGLTAQMVILIAIVCFDQPAMLSTLTFTSTDIIEPAIKHAKNLLSSL